MSAPTATRWVYDFAEGSREMRDLLGGKGANIAEMTRVLGPELVPAGFTITTEACVAYMHGADGGPEGLDDAIDEALARLEEQRRQAARGPGGPAAGLGAQRRARLDAGDDGHGPQPRPQRRVRRGVRGAHRQRPARVGLLPPAGADVRRRGLRRARRTLRGGDRRHQARARREARHRPRRRRAARAHRPLPRPLRLPERPARAAAARDPRRLRLLDGRAGGRLPAHQGHSGRLGHRGQRPADGVRQHGRHLRLGRRVHARRGHRRARAQRRLHRERPGRGRRVGRAHAARPLGAQRLDARDRRAAARDPGQAGAPLQGHAGHRVHGRGGTSVHAADAQRQAPRPGGGALRRRRRRRGPDDEGGGDRDHRRGHARRAAAPHVRTRRPASTASPAEWRPRRARPRARSCSPRRMPWRPPRTAAR